MLILVLLGTGGMRSPLLPLAAGWFALAGARGPRHLAVAITLAFLTLLLVSDGLLFGFGAHGLVAGAASLAVGGGAALAWRAGRRADGAMRDRLRRIDAELDAGLAASVEADAAARAHELADALEDLRLRSGARRVVLWWVDEEAAQARPRSAVGGSAPRTVDLRGDPLGWVWQEGRGTAFDSTPYWGLRGTRPTVLRVRPAPGGMLLSYEFGAEATAPEPMALEGAAGALEGRLALLDALAGAAHQRRRLEALRHALRELPAQREQPAFAELLLTLAVDMVEGTGGALATWDGERGQVIGSLGEDGGPAVGAAYQSLESEAALAVRAGATLLREAYRGRRKGPAVVARGELWAARPRAVLAVPLTTADGVAGVLTVWSSAADHFSPGSVDLLEALAPHAGMQLASVLDYGRMRERSERDPLTNLRNRRALDAALEQEGPRARRYARSLAVVALDVDHFKPVNDRYGHAAGDAVLRRVAVVLSEGVRDVDVAARVGGEEFVLVLPETSAAAAREVAERLRAAIASTVVEHEGERIQVRVSAGVAAWPESAGAPADLLEAADAALYTSKQNGRDRVSVAPPAVPAR
ncbi:MAG: GGDEF domain-containing protein [Gemmatimonadota bacterium]